MERTSDKGQSSDGLVHRNGQVSQGKCAKRGSMVRGGRGANKWAYCGDRYRNRVANLGAGPRKLTAGRRRAMRQEWLAMRIVADSVVLSLWGQPWALRAAAVHKGHVDGQEQSVGRLCARQKGLRRGMRVARADRRAGDAKR